MNVEPKTNYIMRTLKTLSLSLMVAAVFFSCKKNKNGTMEVSMTDAPANYAEVNVEIKKIQVNYTDDTTAWIDLNTNAGVYDLLELQNGKETIIASETEIKAGSMSQLRIILGQNNTVKLDNGNNVNLEMSSQTETGIKVNVNTEVESEAKLDALIDFDANESIFVDGSGVFHLEPVITMVDVEVSGG